MKKRKKNLFECTINIILFIHVSIKKSELEIKMSEFINGNEKKS